MPRRPTPERASPSRCLLPDPPRSAVRCRTCRLEQTCRFAAAALHGAPELRLGQAFQPYTLRARVRLVSSPAFVFEHAPRVDRRGKFGLAGSRHRIDLCSQARGPGVCVAQRLCVCCSTAHLVPSERARRRDRVVRCTGFHLGVRVSKRNPNVKLAPTPGFFTLPYHLTIR